MSWKTIFVLEASRISYAQSNIIIEKDGVKHSVFIGDISTLLIENNRCSVTSQAIAKLAENKAVVVFVDDAFMPVSISLPLKPHSTHSKIAQAQLSMKKPFKKRIWKHLIESKIQNQSEVLQFLEKKYAYLDKLSKTVLSNDDGGNEAKAAKYYWNLLFENFSRQTKGAFDIKNSILNYIHAVIRSSGARSMVAVGIMPIVGVKHQNYFNHFNFVDDVMEPYRPIADLHAYNLLLRYGESEYLETEIKKSCVDVLNMEYVDIGDGVSSVRVAIDITLKSLQKAILEENPQDLLLPKIDFVAFMQAENECI